MGAFTGTSRVTKGFWYAMGGLSNPRCWRRQFGNAWHYFID